MVVVVVVVVVVIVGVVGVLFFYTCPDINSAKDLSNKYKVGTKMNTQKTIYTMYKRCSV